MSHFYQLIVPDPQAQPSVSIIELHFGVLFSFAILIS
jgi:hypothetical protein